MPVVNDLTDIQRMIDAVNRLDFAYFDATHVYMLDGQRCRSVTNVAKIPTDDYMVNQWRHRMAAFGFLHDPTILEDIAAHRDDNRMVEGFIQKAIDVAGANRGAQRGTQAHAATEYHDLDQPLITAQQQRDGTVWARTCEAYGIEVATGYIERVVLYPDDLIAGRIDRYATLRGAGLVDIDIKTGTSATRYPHATAVQLALHVGAPLIQTDRVHRTTDDGSTYETTSGWAAQPDDLRRDVAYVLSMPTRDDAEMGTLYEFTLAGRYAGEVAARAAIFARHFQLNKDLCRPVSAPRPIANGKLVPPEPPERSNVVDFDTARAQGELRARIAMLAEAPKALLRMAWEVDRLGSLTSSMTAEQIAEANALVDTFDGFAQVAPIERSVERHPSNSDPVPRWAVDEGVDPPDADTQMRLSSVYVGMPISARQEVDRLAGEATRHGVTFHGHGEMTRRRYHLITGVMHLAMSDAVDMVRTIVATVAGDTQWPHDERLTEGAVIGLLHADQSEDFAEVVLRFLCGEMQMADDGLRLEPNTTGG